MGYQDINAYTIDRWCRAGWQWGTPVDHKTYVAATQGRWDILLTPTKPVPHDWLGELEGARVLGLAAGGGQQLPILTALGARCTLLDLSREQCASERQVAEREGYEIEVIQGDMTRPLPFPDESFDLIVHPVSNCYIEDVRPVFCECRRVLKPGGALLGGYDLGIAYAFDDEGTTLVHRLPFNPLKDPKLMAEMVERDEGVQFSHTLEEQLGGQLEAGLTITALYEDTDGAGNLHDHGLPTFAATRAVRQA